MNEYERDLRRFQDNLDMLVRAPAVFPIRRDMAALKARWQRGDRNVVAYCDENGHPERFELEFTKSQRAELEAAYKAVRTDLDFDMDTQASVFVRIVESWGDSMLDAAAIKVDDQKTRKRTIESFSKAVEKFDSTLAAMDSGTLGWLYASMVDKLAAEGVQVSRGDDQIVSMRDHGTRAQMEAGELRHDLRRIAAAIIGAAAEAANTLPKYQHTENDPRSRNAQALERLVIEHGIAFDTAETGFPALCLRSMFELGGAETEKVSYWLKKAEDSPDSYAKFLARMRNKNDGENPPSD